MAISPTSPGGDLARRRSSTSFSSTPAIGRPIEPGLRPVRLVERGHRRGLGQPVALQDRRCRRPPRSRAAPRPAARRRRRRRAAARTRRRRRSGPREQRDVHRRHALEDGHPVARRSPRAPAPASNRDTRVRHAPAFTAALSPQVCPKEWNSGRQPMMTSSGRPRAGRSRSPTTLRCRLAWVSSAPLGCRWCRRCRG